MEYLHVFTNNKLDAQFWETRTGLIDAVKIHQIDLDQIETSLMNGVKFLVIDFYFGNLNSEEEQQLTEQICEAAKKIETKELSMFLLSPSYAKCTKMPEPCTKNKAISSHNYSREFLRLLLQKSKKSNLSKQSIAS